MIFPEKLRIFMMKWKNQSYKTACNLYETNVNVLWRNASLKFSVKWWWWYGRWYSHWSFFALPRFVNHEKFATISPPLKCAAFLTIFFLFTIVRRKETKSNSRKKETTICVSVRINFNLRFKLQISVFLFLEAEHQGTSRV